jgi:hypothetical protein
VKSIKAFSLSISFLSISCLAGCSLAGSKSAPASNASSSQHAGRASDSATERASPTTAGNETNETAKTGSEISDQLHTPAKGTEERQAIMDALRAEFDNPKGSYYHAHRGTITFVVNFLRVHNGWAWMGGYPQSSDPQDSFGEYSGFLLHSVEGRWSLMRLPPMVDDPNDPENLGYPSSKDVERIRQKFPTVATDIFPKS